MIASERVAFAQEKLSLIRDEAYPLLLLHWEEIALNKASTPLDPNWHAYKVMEEVGLFHVTTARVDGELVGYVAFIIAANLHYQTMITATDDIFYLHPDHRRGLLGIQLLKASHQAMAALGATKIVHHHKHHFNVGAVFRRLGFDLVEHVYQKAL